MNKEEIYKAALEFHKLGMPGKISITPSKNISNKEDLALAYSPGVAAPVLEIAKNKDKIYDYTSRGNIVAVISNGTAILGLGNLGAYCAGPVIEGKSILFKKFAYIDSFPILVNAVNADEFVNVVKNLEYSFGGINLEDIRSPECFEIESRLIQILDIPVFHDDQHGTAIVVCAGLINAVEIAGKKLSESKIVINGAGAAAIACADLLTELGVSKSNIILCDSKGVVNKSRQDINKWKIKYASDTQDKTLEDALKGGDIFIGLSVKDALPSYMIKNMNKNPIIFALANPDPEILPEIAITTRPDAILATGRSDYPNQINNVLCFPYMFRGALDVKAKVINTAMKKAAVYAIANLVKQETPHNIRKMYSGYELRYSKEYIVPTPFDPRLIVEVSSKVAAAAYKSGVSKLETFDEEKYKLRLSELISTNS